MGGLGGVYNYRWGGGVGVGAWGMATHIYGKPLGGVIKSSLAWRAQSARSVREGKVLLNLEDLAAAPDVVDPKRCVSPRSREALLQCGVLASELRFRDVGSFLREARGDPELAALAHTRYDTKRRAKIDRVVHKRREIVDAEAEAEEAGSPDVPRGTLYQQARILEENVARKRQAGAERRQSATLQGASERLGVVQKGVAYYEKEEAKRRADMERKRRALEEERVEKVRAVASDRRDGEERARQQAHAEREAEALRQKELKHEGRRRQEERRSAATKAAHEAEVERKAAEARAAHEATRRRMQENNETLEERKQRLIRKAEREEALRLERIAEQEARRREQKEEADMARAMRLESARKRDEAIQRKKVADARRKQKAEDARWKDREAEEAERAARKAEAAAERERAREHTYKVSIERLQAFQRATVRKMREQDSRMASSLQKLERKRQVSAFENALKEAERRAGVKEQERADRVKRTIQAEKLEYAMDRVSVMVEAREAVARQRHVDHITQSVLAEKLEHDAHTSLVLRKGTMIKSAIKSIRSSVKLKMALASSALATPTSASRPASGASAAVANLSDAFRQASTNDGDDDAQATPH